jgi:hypothetical protein
VVLNILCNEVFCKVIISMFTLLCITAVALFMKSQKGFTTVLSICSGSASNMFGVQEGPTTTLYVDLSMSLVKVLVSTWAYPQNLAAG